MQFSVRTLAALALLCTAGVANASIITIDLSGNGGNLGQTASFSSGSVNVDIYGWAVRASNGNLRASNIHQNNNGIGIRRGPNALNNDDGSDNWISEFITMAVDGGTLIGVSLTGLNVGEEAAIGSTRNLAPGPGDARLRLVSGIGNAATWFSPRALTRREFGIVAVSDFSPISRFRVDALKVYVPAPAALGLLVLGMGLMLRRRA